VIIQSLSIVDLTEFVKVTQKYCRLCFPNSGVVAVRGGSLRFSSRGEIFFQVDKIWKKLSGTN